MPVVPAWMSTRSDCAKMASPAATSNDPATASPLRTRSQVSRVRLQRPSGVWRQIDPFEHEVRIGDEKRPFVGEPLRSHLKLGRSGVCHRDCVFDVKFTLPAVIEQTERRVAALLDLRNDEPCADRVNRSGGHGNDIVWQTRLATRQDPRSSRRRIASRNCCGVSRRLRPRATLASGAALRTYQASVLPFGSPIECAYASSGWTWMESGWLVNSSLSRSEESVPACRVVRTRFRRCGRLHGLRCSKDVDRPRPKASAAPVYAQVRSP